MSGSVSHSFMFIDMLQEEQTPYQMFQKRDLQGA